LLDRDVVRDEREIGAQDLTCSLSSTRRSTTKAVNVLEPLAMPSWLSVVIAMPWPRSASPYAASRATAPARWNWTTPENPVRAAVSSTRRLNSLIAPR
jgi:hypothetical protein